MKWKIRASLLPSMDVHLQSYWQVWVWWPKMEWIQELVCDFGDLGLSSFRDMWVCPKIGVYPEIWYIPKFVVWDSLFTLWGSPVLQLFATRKIQSLVRPARKKMLHCHPKKGQINGGWREICSSSFFKGFQLLLQREF